MGEILFTFLFNTSFSSISSLSRTFLNRKFDINENSSVNIELIKAILDTKIVDINAIKNFLNQTLLHIVSEKNLVNQCKQLILFGANCLMEDNYRQTPLLIGKFSFYVILRMWILN